MSAAPEALAPGVDPASLERLRRDGYLILPELIPRALVDRVRGPAPLQQATTTGWSLVRVLSSHTNKTNKTVTNPTTTVCTSALIILDTPTALASEKKERERRSLFLCLYQISGGSALANNAQVNKSSHTE